MTTVTGPSRHGGPDLHSYSLLLVQITTWLSTPLTEIIDSWRDSTKNTHKTHKTTPPHIMCSSSASDHIHFLLKLSLLYQEVIIWNQPKLLQGKSPQNLPYPCIVWSPPKKKRFHLMTPVSFPSHPNLKSRSNCCNSEVSVALSEGSSAPADSRWQTTNL